MQGRTLVALRSSGILILKLQLTAPILCTFSGLGVLSALPPVDFPLGPRSVAFCN